ncbi:Cyclic AMP-dependent transcription factor ATF-2 [Geodia barretti]|uniref:Cyclic AMP-dependent transcription factor ATF-2 n=1 Tax=Geodia barretti TaxID=519541 RepID=A0AA35U0P3_GEOBA|nr:Cyclic AMP-dependent transcription factor ATF-2 [Geodia barretti]
MTTENDKPFQCMFEGCGQRFSNNDHLAVHRQKHEFSLKFGIASKTGEALLVDQTPTPTRFLRNVEESGLFQELADNPFDQVQQLYLATVQLPTKKQQKGHLILEFEKSKNGADKQTSVGEAAKVPHPSAEPVTVTTGTSTITIAGISMAPPPSVANPDKPVPMATAPPHMTTASVFTKQLKEQQKYLEAQIASMANQQLNSPDLLSALKAIQQGDCLGKDSGKQLATSPPLFTAPTAVPDHIANPGRK